MPLYTVELSALYTVELSALYTVELGAPHTVLIFKIGLARYVCYDVVLSD